MLDSALMRPRASAFGEPAYPTLSAQAAALMQSLVRNHALVDGNKRMAWAATKLFLRFNDVALRAPSTESGEQLLLDIIAGELALPDIAERLAIWSSPVPPPQTSAD
ncbi:type II toxin-antitoxin system death-on-curing family toxin [Georgenia sp. Z1491]|uniref:type II toxin-antitoxin system death-on-curing family toxin n=1 Tax=Georgenia sp. Z1491 TaxID=3416707 RepID=UPI003CE906FB